MERRRSRRSRREFVWGSGVAGAELLAKVHERLPELRG
jgi:hypothetical protein